MYISYLFALTIKERHEESDEKQKRVTKTRQAEWSLRILWVLFRFFFQVIFSQFNFQFRYSAYLTPYFFPGFPFNLRLK